MRTTPIRKTPGVYVTELDAFPRSVVGVPTAVPAFIGYTERAEIDGKPVYMRPVKIASLADYNAVFGGAFPASFALVPVPLEPPPAPDSYDFMANVLNPDGKATTKTPFKLSQTAKSEFYLYDSVRLFFENGGGTAYVVSVGSYTDNGASPTGVTTESKKLKAGIDAIADQVGPTILLTPDAMTLPPVTTVKDGVTTVDPFKGEGYADVVRAMLTQAKTKQDRVVLLDVYGTKSIDQTKDGWKAKIEDAIASFREQVGEVGLSYGMGYFPFLNTTIHKGTDFTYKVLTGQVTVNNKPTPEDAKAQLTDILKGEALTIYGEEGAKPVYTIIDTAMAATTDAAIGKCNNDLTSAIPLLKQVLALVAKSLNVLPPSGAMAGIYSLTDTNRGVWNAPANVGVAATVSPTLRLTDGIQEDMNVPLNGKAVNAIRDFVGRGTIVWGARTLDGNSNDWRYIQVRRTMIYTEQSIKSALDQFVFAANDGKTWVAVTAMISGFLQTLWSQGGLMGATPNEAFSVECGLGSTMTAQDILEGYMIVQVTLQMIRPAEFIELTFKQKMGGK